jgi:hypothetical protein
MNVSPICVLQSHHRCEIRLAPCNKAADILVILFGFPELLSDEIRGLFRVSFHQFRLLCWTLILPPGTTPACLKPYRSRKACASLVSSTPCRRSQSAATASCLRSQSFAPCTSLEPTRLMSLSFAEIKPSLRSLLAISAWVTPSPVVTSSTTRRITRIEWGFVDRHPRTSWEMGYKSS